MQGILGAYRAARSRLDRLASDFGAIEQQIEQALRGDGPASMPFASIRQVEIRCFGPFEVRVDGETLSLPSGGKAVAVLKLLAARGGASVPRDVLLERLWPEADPAAGANRLRVAVHALRRMLASLDVELVTFADGAYRLSTQAGVLIDADEFERCWQRALRLDAEGHPDEATEACREAERLYRGDYFEDDAFEEWALVRREYLRDVYLNVLVRLAERAHERGEQGACIQRCHAILREDPCNEEAYRLLMSSHAQRGQRARALRWYAVCERTLRDELDASPAPATLELRNRIVQGG